MLLRNITAASKWFLGGGIFVSLWMNFHRSKHVALLDTQTLLSKYTCVLTDKMLCITQKHLLRWHMEKYVQNKNLTGQWLNFDNKSWNNSHFDDKYLKRSIKVDRDPEYMEHITLNRSVWIYTYTNKISIFYANCKYII